MNDQIPMRNAKGRSRVVACFWGAMGHFDWAMRKRRVYLVLLILAVGGVVGLIVTGTLHGREPSAGGKTLSQWLPMLPSNTGLAEPTPAVEAIRQMGSESIPYLLKWSKYEPGPLNRKLSALLEPIILRLSPSTKSFAALENEKKTKARQAMYALVALGPQAEGAVGELSRMLGETNLHFASATVLAPRALASMGKTGLPPLIAALTNRQTPPLLRCYVESSMGRMGTNASGALPVLQQALTSADRPVRISATNVLRGLDYDREGALNRR